MEFLSNKFKFLFEAQKILGQPTVPAFAKLDALTIYADSEIAYPAILRSAIKGEAGVSQLLSGKSMSITNIKSDAELISAIEKIHNQPEVEEVVIQNQIPWDLHLTLVFENDFLFVETKTTENQIQFFYCNKFGHTVDSSNILPKLKAVLSKLTSLIDSKKLWLMELGLMNDELYLFQLQPVEPLLLRSLFSQNLAYEMLLSRNRFQSRQNLWDMIRTEWDAYFFRKKFIKEKSFPPSYVFLNWEFIFHYFKIFCMVKNLRPVENSFASFLSQAGMDKNWLGEIVRTHFKIANRLRLDETSADANFIFEHRSSVIFIGKGRFEGKVGSEAVMVAELSPEIVYGLKNPGIILTRTLSLLSHGILAASENKIMVVAGISDELWKQFGECESFYLDFDNREIRLK